MTLPARAALFLYALLPFVRNTRAGLDPFPPPRSSSASAASAGWRGREVSHKFGWKYIPDPEEEVKHD